MKIFKLLMSVLALAALALAQNSPAGPNVRLMSGAAAATTLACDSSSVGAIYTQTSPGGVTYVCQQSSTVGTYAWVTAPSVSGGSLVIAAGKTFTVNNTLTLAGTDSTTMMFPGTSDTVVTLGATQTLTAKTLTAPVIATISNTGTETLPSTTGGIPIVIACGNTTTGSGTCANTAVGATAKVYFGNATLASNAQTVTISPGFTSSSTFQCLGNDQTTRANPVQVVPASGTTFTITNTSGASDVIQWACFGY
jgi:hypothetical protein